MCDLRRLQWLESSEQEELLGSRKRIKAWLEAVENATNPQFDEVHSKLYGTSFNKIRLSQQKNVR
jgi:hypothetical protein